MSKDDTHFLFILAAYSVSALLMAFEVWQLVRRSRGQAAPQEADHEA